jgi:hypothetical protein
VILLFPFWSRLGWSLVPIFMIIAVWAVAMKGRSDKMSSLSNHPTAVAVANSNSEENIS